MTEHSQDGSFAAHVSYSGNYALVSSLYHGVSLWDLQTKGIKYQWQHASAGERLTFKDGTSTNSMVDYNFVFASAISYDDSHAVMADKENFSLWNINTGENIGFWQVRKSKVRRIPETEQNYWQARAARGKSQDYNTSDYEIVNSNSCANPNPANNEECLILGKIRAIDVSNYGNHIVIGKSNGLVVHISVNSGRRIEFLGHQTELLDSKGEPKHINNAINSVAVSPNGHYVLSGSSDKNAYLWDSKTGQVVYKFHHANRVVQVALDPKGRFAFTADSKNQAQIWDLKTGKPLSNLQFVERQSIFSFARFSANGKWLATGAPNRELTLWDIKSGKKLQQWLVTPRKDSRPASAVVYSAAFINDQTQLISESSAGLSEVWNINYE